MVLIFDLDDTLYDERSYALSGFRAVAHYLNKTHGLPEAKIYREMVLIEAERGQIFDRVLLNHGAYSKLLVKQCVKIYRQHPPKLRPFPDAVRCLRRFRGFPIYVLTDGHKEVQLKKLKALKLWKSRHIKHSYRTNAYGKRYAKPHSHCFDLIAKREGEKPENIVYIGDNPSKDFLIKRKGFKTVRVKRGHHKTLDLGPEYEAHVIVHNLDQLTLKTLKKLGVKHEV
jgi:putative hydrolase of the HAD superfamily